MLQCTVIHTAIGGTLEAGEGSTLVGFIDFLQAGSGIFDLNHTEVFPEFEGQGYGRKLVRAAVDWARAEPVKLKATCPYARKLLDHTPDYSDIAVPN